MAKKHGSQSGVWSHGNSEHEGARIGGGEFAGMPHEVHMAHYPKAKEMGPTDLDDTITEIDGANSKAHMKSRKYMSDQH